jgi:hypothetical protein
MTWLRVNASCGCFVLLVLSAAAAQGQETKATDKGIDPTTIAVYQKLGATFYSGSDYHTMLGWDLYQRGEKGVPGFFFRKFPTSKLPVVAVPFGLDLIESGPHAHDPRSPASKM